MAARCRALACARRGFSYLGDDLCVVEATASAADGPSLVHGLYATAKLNPDSLERLDAGAWPGLGTTPSGKAAVALPTLPVRSTTFELMSAGRMYYCSMPVMSSLPLRPSPSS